MLTGFLIKHPSCLVGYISLSASRFISPVDMKQILTLISITKIFSHNSNPFICGILIADHRNLANFGRVYAAYGGVLIFSSIIWGALIDRKRPDKYEIVGSLIVILGTAIIYYSPR
jgi:drug/metabolite transporter superfamily protein YnfA